MTLEELYSLPNIAWARSRVIIEDVRNRLREYQRAERTFKALVRLVVFRREATV